MLNIGRSYNKYGLNVMPNGDVVYKEWAPGAQSIAIFGDFNGWNREEYRVGKDEFGTFNCVIKANADGKRTLILTPVQREWKIHL